jgi:hypothetical protein
MQDPELFIFNDGRSNTYITLKVALIRLEVVMKFKKPKLLFTKYQWLWQHRIFCFSHFMHYYVLYCIRKTLNVDSVNSIIDYVSEDINLSEENVP